MDINAENWAILTDNIAMRPISDRILIREDEFKSRYDCLACEGKGHTNIVCPRCLGSKLYKSSRFKHKEDENEEPCPDCTVRGDGTRNNPTDKTYGKVLCAVCNGKQGSIILTDDSKKRPTTGTIIAIGSEVTEYRVGARVLYHNFTGTAFEMYKTALRVMRQNDVYCEIRGLNPDSPVGLPKAELEESGVQ